MAWRGPSEAQWERIGPWLPARQRNPRGGRPTADDRKCFEGILWILWTGSPWSELPRKYGSPDDLLAAASNLGKERHPARAVASVPGRPE